MLRITVAVALPRHQEVIAIELAAGATVADALASPVVRGRFPALDAATAAVGIWSRPCKPDTALRDGDRVEVYRGLKADPKAARRTRARVKPASTRSRSGP